jgi:hypothetical protein
LSKCKHYKFDKFIFLFFQANSFVSLTLQRKISQLTNKQTNTPNATSVDTHSSNQSEDQALKNITNSSILPISSMDQDHISSNRDDDDDDFIAVDDLDNENGGDSNENIENITNAVNNYLAGNNIAGSVNSPDIISSKLSEYINSNLPHIEKSTNNHLVAANDMQRAAAAGNANSSSSASGNSQFIKTHRKQLSDESFHHIQIFRNSATNASTSNNNNNSAPTGNAKRSIKKTRVNFYYYYYTWKK